MNRLLLIEDNTVNREMLCRRLEAKGFSMLSAESGEQGIEVALKEKPELILMDIGLPGIDGWETTRRLSANPTTRAIPVIGLSAHAQAIDREKSLAAGCVEFETKPIQLQQLIVKIQTALANRQAIAPTLDEDPESIFTAPSPKSNPAGETAILRVQPRKLPSQDAEKVVCPIARKRIVVVEDNDANREMLKRRLEKQGFQVGVAADGKQALDLARREPFDLMLLDIMMPEMDGYEVLRIIKSDSELTTLPVIMISALDEMSSVVRCIEAGAEDYLMKPYDPVLLQARINASLDKRRVRDQEIEYFRSVAELTEAAAAVEKGTFDPQKLQDVLQRSDELGRLARVFEKMASEVQAREQSLRMEVARLKVEVDEARKLEQVLEITESTYFQQLQEKAKTLRKRLNRDPENSPPSG